MVERTSDTKWRSSRTRQRLYKCVSTDCSANNRVLLANMQRSYTAVVFCFKQPRIGNAETLLQSS